MEGALEKQGGQEVENVDPIDGLVSDWKGKVRNGVGRSLEAHASFAAWRFMLTAARQTHE